MNHQRYEVKQHEDVFPLYTLKDAETSSSVTICPERGAIAISCKLHGEELFYFDRATFVDPQTNIRGGNPVLFPICGQLVDGQYEWKGETYAMRNHGVARNRPWEVVSVSEDGEASLTVRLRNTDSTLAEYPFAFELLFTYALVDGELRIRQSYRNLSIRSMPFYAGFHPYFRAESKNLVYDTDATKYLDYNDNAVKPIEGSISLEGLKESVALLDASARRIAFPGPEGGTITLSYSDAFRYVVLWQVNGSPFVCVEPWMALNSALNTRDELPELEAGGQLALELAIGFSR
ncbi:aldose epimerase [Paenibacillus sacheonensis]|uniref:Aldose epimerase n=1 Tax=Paenibacillus sacheonensis TaxID=742054 RepID=A0A7X5C1F4_9BACL|nr:aldose epimerase [Paenibacillus sacheonensis]MBM7568981.1 galactose mutarotase-like enzyme [Paenibacillus sacheonensis]NBC72646.1 aldose epimerase [Paenibacillus sacheonensis]